MDNFLQQIFAILTTPPGNLIYHLALAFATMAALQAVLAARRASHFIYTRRILFGLAVLLAGQIVLFVFSGLSWQGLTNPHLLLPPLERAVTAISLIWIIWLWSFPTPARFADISTGLLNFAVLVLYLFTMTAWNNQLSAPSFNASGLDWSWQIFSIFIAIAGILLLLFRRPAGWGFGFSMLLFSITGAIFHLLQGATNGDFAAPVRLFQLCAYPLLPALAQHLHGISVPETTSPEIEGDQSDHKQWKKDPRTINSWVHLAWRQDKDALYAGLTQAVAQTITADLCYLMHSVSNTDDIKIVCGYDLLREERLPAIVLEKNKLPALHGALQREKPLRLDHENQSTPDFEALAAATGLKKPGNLLLIPLNSQGNARWGLLLLSPYSNKIWDTEDQTFLMAIAEPISKLLLHSETTPTTALQQESLKSEQDKILPTGIEQQSALQIENLISVQKDLQTIIESLQTENDQLRAALKTEAASKSEPPGNVQYFESELHLALEEVAHLQNALAGANMKILSLEMQNRNSNRESSDHKEVAASIVQEIRQPMASIVGYTDLLMTESVGILGELQRKFLERIKSSIERMNTLLSDLIRISNAVDEDVQYQPQVVDVTEVVDEALSETSSQLREKNITLRVDLPDSLPAIRADRDALQQIIIHLLQNAGAASPPEGIVDLRLRLQEDENDFSYMLLQVTDTGGGIATEDLPRVFSRQYRADNPLIQGLGDTGVGLSIARTLTEAQGGRIWAESNPGKSTTFSILLPIQSDTLVESETPQTE
ncbi:MAG: HAMP domain-containing histidine kinase [Anaerolineae bacterium]|nr:HAMP domain-containing histidine kinase [Anaerolineae bacterium]